MLGRIEGEASFSAVRQIENKNVRFWLPSRENQALTIGR